MGLLDSILGGIAGNALGRAGGIGLGRGRGMRGNLLMALLPVVLSMLANRRGGAAAGRGAIPGLGNAGGLGGLGALAGLGGLGALLQRFQQKGYGDQVQSWVGTGENQPIPPEAVGDVFGADELSQIASQAGVSVDEARAGLSELLPQVVDNFTPQGELPDLDRLTSSIDQLIQDMAQNPDPRS